MFLRTVSPPIYSVGFIYKGTIKMNTKLHHNQFNILTLFFLSFMNFMVKNKSRRSPLYILVFIRAYSWFPKILLSCQNAVKNPCNLRNPWIKIMKNKANLKTLNMLATNYSRGLYNDFHPKTKNGTNPNKANQSQFPRQETPRLSSETQTKIKKMKSKANFKIAKSYQTRVFYTIIRCFQAPHVIKPIKSKPNPNPKQSQYTCRSEDGNPKKNHLGRWRNLGCRGEIWPSGAPKDFSRPLQLRLSQTIFSKLYAKGVTFENDF